MPTLKISASVESDDRQSRGSFDAAPWFMDPSTTDEDIRMLFRFGLGRCPRADEVVLHDGCETQRGPEKVFHYLSTFKPRKRDDNAIIGFEVTINEREAMLWLRENRYALWEELRALAREEAAYQVEEMLAAG